MPYGETLLDLSHTHYETPYQFTGYEKDQETGLHYAGARYYDSRLSIFNSTDPMWYKYPHLSPYAYCANNPLRLIDPNGREPVDPRTGKQVKLNLYRAAICDLIYTNQHIRGENLYSKASPLIPRQRGTPDGIWSGGSYFVHPSVWESISSDAQNKLSALFPNKENVNCDYGAPNDLMWRAAAEAGSYIYVDDKYSVSEVFRLGEKSFNVTTVNENYITQIINLNRANSNEEFNINSVTTFDIEKGAVQSRQVKNWWGGSKIEKFRKLNVTETIQQYKNNQAAGSKKIIRYTTEEIIK